MFRFLRRVAVAAALALCVSLTAGAVAQAACPTANPQANATSQGADFSTDAGIQAAFTQARAAEGCSTPLVLPANYDTLTPQQQNLTLFNLEREARGLVDFQLDPSIMSQVALTHAQEMAQYNYFEHTSPINSLTTQSAFVDVSRQKVNPVFANDFFGEDIAAGTSTAAEAVFDYMYQDADQGWGHRGAILQGAWTWVGIGILQNVGSGYGSYYVEDFSALHPGYAPPPKPDTGAPSIGQVGYANGVATATGVADSPQNVTSQGPNPSTAGITGVVFYVNNIVDGDNQGTSWNTVAATQSSPGTWTAPVTVNPGDVLHAVAVDGSGNYTDVTGGPPPVTLAPGANTVALPAADGGAGTATATAARRRVSPLRAVTPTTAALATSIDRQLGRRAVRDIRLYVHRRWVVYRPGRSANLPLFFGNGVVVDLSRGGHWRAPVRRERFRAPTLHLRAGWNFVSVPYPETGMTCHAVRLELAALGSALQQITVGPSPTVGVIMRPHHGTWGNDLLALLPYQKGFWVKVRRAVTWVPSPLGYRHLRARAVR